MTDIVERLRAPSGDIFPMCREAADEIKRLRAVIERLLTSNAAYVSERDELRGEVERLRAALQEIADYYEHEFREGEKAYQAVIAARRALEHKP